MTADNIESADVLFKQRKVAAVTVPLVGDRVRPGGNGGVGSDNCGGGVGGDATVTTPAHKPRMSKVARYVLLTLLGLVYVRVWVSIFLVSPLYNDGSARAEYTEVAAALAANAPAFVVVTAASASYFDRLENFVGSVHFWEPLQRVVVYDVGLTASQTARVRCWRNVELRLFDFDAYPHHVRNVYTFAWKLYLHQHALSLVNDGDVVLVLDSGVELRRSLDAVRAVIARDGYFTVRQSNFVGRKTNPLTLSALKLDGDGVVWRDVPFCAGGLQAWVKGGAAERLVLTPAVACATDERCIDPPVSGRDNHNYDQSVVSALMHMAGYKAQRRAIFAEGRLARVTADETRFNHVVIALRRWQRPLPYTSHLALKDQCIVAEPPYPRKNFRLLESRKGFIIDSDSPIPPCLRAHNNDRDACAHLIPQGITAAGGGSEGVAMFVERAYNRYAVEPVGSADDLVTLFVTILFYVACDDLSHCCSLVRTKSHRSS
jgi:hypothetical protein